MDPNKKTDKGNGAADPKPAAAPAPASKQNAAQLNEYRAKIVAGAIERLEELDPEMTERGREGSQDQETSGGKEGGGGEERQEREQKGGNEEMGKDEGGLGNGIGMGMGVGRNNI
ncbi:hypothetical protein K491DRAFT_783522 [Lophiostoma macrostomum CBS 122681]|uniref:Uncharacterized protein n=1 Tax=Lophiostoma macrostomum CBS 122681 TaxID=1314788 RepID=A0A6A6SSN6_9PLEO|nr:hypothetical protein K491DRAFT_783522 [Lophiostoma macrostomum CBS 122681]